MTGALFAAAGATVAYVFVGYPALVAAVARLRPRPVKRANGHHPRASLVIVAYNEADVIAGKLDNAFDFEYPRDALELIVVADGSTDETADVARSFEGVDVLHQPERQGKAAALARGAAAATGEIVVFSDANNLLSPNAVAAIVEHFADPAVGVVTGQKAIADENGRPLDRAEGLYWKYESRIKGWESTIGSTTGISGEVLAVRRDAFRPPPPDSILDDFEIALLAAADGWRVTYVPEALSLEPASASVADEVERRTRIVAGLYQTLVRRLPLVARRHPGLAFQLVSHKGLRPLVPYALAVAAASSVAAFPAARWAKAAVGLQALFYSAALVGLRDVRRGRRRLAFFLPFYFCEMNVVAVRGLVRFLRRQESAAWERVRRG